MKTILNQQERLKSIESNLSNAWKISKKEGKDWGLGRQTQWRAHQEQMDAEIYELKIDLQSMVDRLRVKECHLFS